MADLPDFQKKQYAFAAHIRDPEGVAAPEGVEERRMEIYRTLFFNNLYSLLGQMFPVLRKIHDDGQWRAFIRGFMRHHTAQTPYFLQLPEEFLAFLKDEYEPTDDDHPFLVELAHYEYVELALSVSTAADDPATIDPDGNLLDGVPQKSELAWAYGYEYPVHRISPDFLPRDPHPVWLALYRDSDDKVRFLELNAVTSALLDAIDKNVSNRTGEQLLRDLAASTHYPDVDAFVTHGASALEEMRQLGILAGTRIKS